MIRSLFTGVTGLKNFQTKMDVISNNISNVPHMYPSLFVNDNAFIFLEKYLSDLPKCHYITSIKEVARFATFTLFEPY